MKTISAWNTEFETCRSRKVAVFQDMGSAVIGFVCGGTAPLDLMLHVIKGDLRLANVTGSKVDTPGIHQISLREIADPAQYPAHPVRSGGFHQNVTHRTRFRSDRSARLQTQ